MYRILLHQFWCIFPCKIFYTSQPCKIFVTIRIFAIISVKNIEIYDYSICNYIFFKYEKSYISNTAAQSGRNIKCVKPAPWIPIKISEFLVISNCFLNETFLLYTIYTVKKYFVFVLKLFFVKIFVSLNF